MPIRKATVVVGIIAIVVAAWLVFVAKNYATVVGPYQVIDPQTIVVEAVGAPRGWTRVTSVVESATEVRITVQVWDWLPGPGTGYGVRVQLTVHLSQPLGDRRVTDGEGHPLQLVRGSSLR